MTVTVLTLLKRRDGMSKADFIAYYEANHRRIGERVLAGYATRYVRRYLFPSDGADQPCDADVVMEIDFPDAAKLRSIPNSRSFSCGVSTAVGSSRMSRLASR